MQFLIYNHCEVDYLLIKRNGSSLLVKIFFLFVSYFIFWSLLPCEGWSLIPYEDWSFFPWEEFSLHPKVGFHSYLWWLFLFSFLLGIVVDLWILFARSPIFFYFWSLCYIQILKKNSYAKRLICAETFLLCQLEKPNLLVEYDLKEVI